MKLYTASQMHQADQQSGISLQQLMENAGQAVADVALNIFPNATSFLMLCGKGNNGGDGYVAARHLFQAQKNVVLLELITSNETLSTHEARLARSAYLDLQPSYALNQENLDRALRTCDVIIDGLLGSGLSRPLQEPLSIWVAAVNSSKKPILSIDIPSGIFSDSSSIQGPHIQATYTLQLAGAKLASAFYPAKKAFGHWEVANIGIPESVLQGLSKIHLLDDATVKPWLPKRGADVHKYSAGTVLVIAGSSRYVGAAELACRAAYRAGAGLVTLAAETRFSHSWPEIIFEALDWSNYPLQALQAIDSKRAQVRVIGPGLGEQAIPYLPEIIMQSMVPTVVDAGALVLSDPWANAVREHSRCVLTPHHGEAAKLLRTSSQEIRANPLEAAKTLAQSLNATIILKAATTIITDGNTIAVSLRGHPGMATGGTGDVLAGCIGAFLADAERTFERVATAVYLHGLAGEHAARHYHFGLRAFDVLEAFPKVWQRLETTLSHPQIPADAF
jgi:NAD(P)H-hydrate epimerase